MDGLARALDLARSHAGLTGDNPSVGCVIVRDGRVVGEGATAEGGRPHAETQALARAGELARGADVFVTLEPCAHHGQTPPCADALVEAGVRSVTVGMIDPDPRVCWRGAARLQEAGVDVRVEAWPEVRAFYADYIARRSG